MHKAVRLFWPVLWLYNLIFIPLRCRQTFFSLKPSFFCQVAATTSTLHCLFVKFLAKQKIQYKVMGQVYTIGEADLQQWLCVANGHLLWTIGGWFHFFAIALHFYLQMVINRLFWGLIIVILCAMFSHPAHILFTGSFYCGASEPVLLYCNSLLQEWLLLGTVA